MNKENTMDIAQRKAELSLAVFDSKNERRHEAKAQDDKGKKKAKTSRIDSLISHTNMNRNVS
jgi:hypothetical protein